MSSRRFLPVLIAGAQQPFGAASDPENGGFDLARAGYVEEEYLLEGAAGFWISGAVGEPTREGTTVPYRTRVLVRYPSDRRSASGVTHVEPLHPHMDAGLTWEALSAHLIRRGDAWVGVTVYPHVAELMRERIDPARYGALVVPAGGAEWDIFSDALEAVRHDEFGALRASRIVISGRSATGSFCRVFARERFVTARGGLADAVGIFISSGGAGLAGYPLLSSASPAVPADDARRTVRDVGIPVFEVLSETESETHRAQLRDDSDEPGDVYRLFQIAGSAHIEEWPAARSNNAARLAAAGADTGPIAVREQRSDARSDLISRALMDHLIGAANGGVAPRAPRFVYNDGEVPVHQLLRRDADGNVVGGIRSPWVQAPLAAYAPHGTPQDGDGEGPEWTPLADRALAAGLVGTMAAFSSAEAVRRYGDVDEYLRQFEAATGDLVDAGLLLAADAPELNATAPGRWRE